MPNPQQPELRRSGLGSTTDDSIKSKAATAPPAEDHGAAPVPPANQPGHHPDEEQDKPDIDAFVERASGRSDPED